MTAKAVTWRARAAKKPAVFTIPADAPFVDSLARGILDDSGGDPLALAKVTVLLPTRRAARSLREAFLRLSEGRPLLLPRLMALNDMDDEEALFAGFGFSDAVADIAPPIAPLKRQLLLAKLIQASGESHPEQAVRLAQELAKLLDQVQTERLSFDKLKDLVPDDYAEHWKVTLNFLQILTAHWPGILAGEGALDPAEHRNRVFAAQAAAWAKTGAGGPVIAAGSTGSIPATADVLETVANLADGCVVLPGLDRDLEAEGWESVDETHPQYGLKQLLSRLSMTRNDVQTWPSAQQTTPIHTPKTANGAPKTPFATSSAANRGRFMSEVMRPAATTQAWRELSGFDSSAVEGLTRIDCPSPREESEAVALVMREALVVEGRTCALVTPDRALAERVTAELKRWHIEIDDSAGRDLHQTPSGAFLRLTAVMVMEEFAPVPTLAVCKHPLAAAGRDPLEFRTLTRLAEREILRGPRPPAGLAGFTAVAKLSHRKRDVDTWIGLLKSCCGPFAVLMKKKAVPLSALLNAHMEAAEALAATHDTPGPLRLWAEDAGEAAASFVAELAQCGDVLAPIAPAVYPALLEALMDGRVVRPRYGKHPRLHILGPLEARLQRFDVLILSGLNEGTWPANAPADPWMSRPMRKSFGLPLPERRIGQAAHDISQFLCAPRVVMTRARKVEGTPTVPSRWLMRLERVIEAAGLAAAFADEQDAWLPWAKELTTPKTFESILPPAPKPPVTARPRRLSVTQIETWMRDPYGVYARHVLKLEPLDPLEQDVSAADYGTLIHKTLHDFIAAHPSGALPPKALETLTAMGRAHFEEQAPRPGVMAFWWPRFERIAAWFVGYEGARRGTLARSFVEQKGEMMLAGPGGPFKLVATADRIDRGKDGSITIIDYKTGSPPSHTEVIAGFAPQLPLEAAIAMAGGFKDVPQGTVEALSFWQLHGRDDGGAEKPVKGDAAEMAVNAHKGLTELIAKFDDVNTPYEARPNPEHAPKYSDYGHLARVKEWAAGEDDGGA
jgi:ATP-dependent helicase/nuclease subunit B